MKTAIATAFVLALLVIACGSGSTSSVPEEAGPPGERLFRTHCTLCHGKDGRLGFNGAKDLTVSKLTRAEMTAQVANGKGAMMPYRNTLSAKEIEQVVDYVRTLGKAK
jgi:mono/diheme cytochrome c family protein